ncbi:hypothetical protein CDL15_Pgr023052 [Punica granatum]|uniref:Uncharacterized protein n=1 Tax=Punica granatum TaxID=22663 RepID=A0A218X4R4_PUNGR|nr:hypothetical protein CDL15_Pgr023052 [Punica granatum]
MKWRETKVNVEDHIIVPDIKPSCIESPDQFVEDYVASLTETQMELSKPLWEIHLLDLQNSDAAGLIIGRYHHSIGDGASLMAMLFACSHRPVQPPMALVNQPGNGGDTVSLTRTGLIQQAFSRFCASLAVFWNTCIGIFFFVMTVLFLRDTETPLTGGPGVETAPKRFVRLAFYLRDIKLVKDAMKVTVNDVLLGITEAGLSQYLNRRYGHGGSLLISYSRFVKARIQLTVMAGSRVGYFLLPLSIALWDDPLECIRKAKGAIDRRKRSHEALFTFCLSGFVLKSFGLKVRSFVGVYIALMNVLSIGSGCTVLPSTLQTTATYSNMMGSFEEVDFFGHPLGYIAFGTYGYPRTLSINFICYVDKMTLLVAVDKKAIPDPQRLCDDIEAALKLAIDACSVSD